MTADIFFPFARLLVLAVALSGLVSVKEVLGNDELRSGQKFEIVGELYAHRVCDDLSSREVSIISLVPLRLSGPEIISRQLVPIGSLLTIIGKAPERFFAFIYPDRYIVQVNTISAESGIPIVLDLSRQIEGKSTTLNPKIFKPLF